jgi:hypothetical protein
MILEDMILRDEVPAQFSAPQAVSSTIRFFGYISAPQREQIS